MITLISQSATRSTTSPKSVEEALLWDYSFTYDGEADSYDVTFNESRRETRETNGEGAIAIERLNVLETRSVRVHVEGVTFAKLLVPFIEHHDAIAVEDVDVLLKQIEGAAQFSIGCYYLYDLAGIPVELPVVLVARQDYAAELGAAMHGAVAQWLDAAQPPSTNARLRLDLTVWSAADAEQPLVRLSHLVMPMRTPAL